MIFKHPFYVSPHAVQRFRERVADHLTTKVVRVIIQAALQDNRQLVLVQSFNRQSCPVFRAKYQGVEYLIPVLREATKKAGWPVVPTILLPGMETNRLYERSGWNWKS